MSCFQTSRPLIRLQYRISCNISKTYGGIVLPLCRCCQTQDRMKLRKSENQFYPTCLKEIFPVSSPKALVKRERVNQQHQQIRQSTLSIISRMMYLQRVKRRCQRSMGSPEDLNFSSLSCCCTITTKAIPLFWPIRMSSDSSPDSSPRSRAQC